VITSDHDGHHLHQCPFCTTYKTRKGIRRNPSGAGRLGVDGRCLFESVVIRGNPWLPFFRLGGKDSRIRLQSHWRPSPAVVAFTVPTSKRASWAFPEPSIRLSGGAAAMHLGCGYRFAGLTAPPIHLTAPSTQPLGKPCHLSQSSLSLSTCSRASLYCSLPEHANSQCDVDGLPGPALPASTSSLVQRGSAAMLKPLRRANPPASALAL
jgi:hypothetical protein